LQDPDSPASGCPGHNFTRWRNGSKITVIVHSPSISERHFLALQAASQDVQKASNDRIEARVIARKKLPSKPRAGQILVYSPPDPRQEGCLEQKGCALATFRVKGPAWEIIGGKYVMGPSKSPESAVHDVVGHLIFGLCHVNASTAPKSLMASGPNFFDTDY